MDPCKSCYYREIGSKKECNKCPYNPSVRKKSKGTTYEKEEKSFSSQIDMKELTERINKEIIRNLGKRIDEKNKKKKSSY